ncbi:MAG TPA: threonine--tRNA ligase [Aggregatilineaceae bacterium]|nr:threonine--tRNA ligase [Anaerolineae bacterium]HMM28614.1 threonine--tRNA ligase [Aggregatilineaceae bacterium]
MERYADSKLYRIRHSAAHVMAQAVLEKFPEAKIAIGPPIEDGFYYDFDLPRPLTEEDLAEIEARMRAIIREGHDFTRREVSADEARALFADQPYKLELIDGLDRGGLDEYGEKTSEPVVISTYTQDTFEDLCRGPHVANTREINPDAVSITFKAPAGAYWRGDEHREMLTRIYGTAWETAEELEEYLALLEEAKKRDHRTLGPKLGLFVIDPLVGKGLPLWKPKGAMLRDTLERFLRAAQIERGYQPVVTPHIGKLDLYRTSGHYPYYKDSQYSPIDVDGEEFLLRPMNCPHHIMIYKSELHSYRDLPVRYAEFGTVYRYEQSGELSGLTRVRGFTIDDSHLFVTPDQLLDEFIGVVRLTQHVFSSLGMSDFRVRVGTRDPESDKYVGSDESWERATAAIIQACEQLGLNYVVEAGEAAFYGPKLDFIFRDVLKREWQLGTVQVDYNLPERFELEYIGEDNERHRPVMIHRAPFGSLERFVGILIEHFNGAFPAWLAPVQAVLIPVADRHLDYARDVAQQLHDAGMRVEVDDSSNRMGAKIRNQTQMRIPWLLVVGDRDIEKSAVSVRLRTGEDLGAMGVKEFISHATYLIDVKSLALD